jgi:phosphoribosyl-AMP cyclohydrolase
MIRTAKVPVGNDFEARQSGGFVELEWTETEKVFDPEEVYGDAPNPTIL